MLASFSDRAWFAHSDLSKCAYILNPIISVKRFRILKAAIISPLVCPSPAIISLLIYSLYCFVYLMIFRRVYYTVF